jgi:hypothetical protein
LIRILGAVALAVGTASTACADWMDAELGPSTDDAPAVVLHGAGMGLREGRAIIVEVESRDFIPFVSFLPFAPSQPETGGFSTRTVYDQVDGATVARDCLFRRPDGLGDFDAPVDVSVTAVSYEESGLPFPLTGAYRIRFIEVEPADCDDMAVDISAEGGPSEHREATGPGDFSWVCPSFGDLGPAGRQNDAGLNGLLLYRSFLEPDVYYSYGMGLAGPATAMVAQVPGGWENRNCQDYSLIAFYPLEPVGAGRPANPVDRGEWRTWYLLPSGTMREKLRAQ